MRHRGHTTIADVGLFHHHHHHTTSPFLGLGLSFILEISPETATLAEKFSMVNRHCGSKVQKRDNRLKDIPSPNEVRFVVQKA